MIDSKDCIVCWKTYFKKVNCSRKNRSKSTCCSKECNIKVFSQSKWFLWKHHSEETRNIISNAGIWRNLGNTYWFKKWQEAWNKWLKGFQSGEKSNFWRWWAMQTRPLKVQVRESREMDRWTKWVFERDNYTCQDCLIRSAKGTGRVTLHAHHKIAFAILFIQHNIQSFDEAMECKELRNVENWKTLCKDCHKKTDSFKLNQYSPSART